MQLKYGEKKTGWIIRFLTCTFMEDIPCLPRDQTRLNAHLLPIMNPGRIKYLFFDRLAYRSDTPNLDGDGDGSILHFMFSVSIILFIHLPTHCFIRAVILYCLNMHLKKLKNWCRLEVS